MKTAITFLLSFIAFAGYAQGYEQDESPEIKTSRYGIKAGYNAAYINNTLNMGPNHKSDFHIGGFKEFRSNSFAIQPELVYSRQGCKTNYHGHFYYNYGNTKINLSYVTTPVLIKGIIANKLSFYTGIQPGILIAAKEKGTADDKRVSGGAKEINVSVTENYNGFDFAVPVGFEIIFSKTISTSFRYTHGLTNINADPKMEAYRERFGLRKTTMKNQVFQISLQYFL